jgi:hypothetical protein
LFGIFWISAFLVNNSSIRIVFDELGLYEFGTP